MTHINGADLSIVAPKTAETFQIAHVNVRNRIAAAVKVYELGIAGYIDG